MECSAPMLDANEIRAAFNHQYGSNHSGSDWVRLNLSAGPVLARRNMSHHSSPIYIALLNQGAVRYYMVTISRQLKSNGSTHVTPGIRDAWATLIGYTEDEYQWAKADDAKTRFTEERIAMYEGRKIE